MSNYSEDPAHSNLETLIKFLPNNMDTPDVEVGRYDTKPHSRVAFRTYRHPILHIAVKLACYIHISLNYFFTKEYTCQGKSWNDGK